MRPLFQASVWLTVTVLVLSTGCGGTSGDGGPGPDPVPLTTFVGAYRFVSVSGNAGLGLGEDPHVGASHGTAVVDGLGTITIVSWPFATATGGALPMPGPSEATVTYEESDTGRVALIYETGGPPVTIAAGYVSPDGEHVLLAAGEEGLDPTMLLFSRTVTSVEEAECTGEFHSALWAIAEDATGRVAGIGHADLNLGGDTVNTIDVLNGDGGVLSGPFPQTGMWTVEPDGDLDLWFPGGGFAYSGGLACGGDLLFGAGSLNAGQGPTLLCYLREGVGLGSADFDGSYYAVGFTWRPSDGHYVGYFGSITAYGTGTYQRQLNSNDEGTFGLGGAIGNTYTVVADGGLTLNMGSIGRWRGGLSPTGDLAILGGGTVTDDPPGIFVLIRR